jgi:AcrR family transcriptional regulator
MARPTGSRDKQFETRRVALIAAARQHLGAPGGRNASWRDLAAACGVSVSTLAHYFGTRTALVAAILEQSGKDGAIYLEMAARPSGPFAQSIADLVRSIGQGFDYGVLTLQVIGLSEGFAHPDAAAAYLGHHLEPILGAIRTRLQAHIDRGDMRPTDARFAAISLLAPMVIARLHQSALGGAAGFPMSLPDFDAAHTGAFTRAFAADA